ncbi:Thioredoxin domain-containing protein [Heracleum sosnowskyi]|uniref:Thioredoxin domain-containing protein n=1 Tax=Heracleum sosnowskyi TaxID=360622 RepID=A0AAD8IWD4_9APIA|nr:Thioredoxin domain-containing protein [Heracleum sosnowskyi]
MGHCLCKSSRNDNDCDSYHFSKKTLRASNVSLITDHKQWEEKRSQADKASKIVLVNFSASWCGPCGDVLPLFCSLAKKYKSMMFLVVDVDELAEFSTSWGIRATPTIIFLKHGHEVDKLVGANKEELQRRTEIMARA